MKLNGWQRLWVFSSMPWVLGGLFGVVYGVKHLEFETISSSIFIGLGFPAFMYAFGWGIAWIRRGFKQNDPKA